MGRRRRRTAFDYDDVGDTFVVDVGDTSEEEVEGEDGAALFGAADADLQEEAELFIDPEARRKKTRQTKNQATYGVWADSDSEDAGARHASVRKAQFSAGVNFVKSGAAGSPALADSNEDREEAEFEPPSSKDVESPVKEEWEDDSQARHGGLGFAAAGAAAGTRSARARSPASSRSDALPATSSARSGLGAADATAEAGGAPSPSSGAGYPSSQRSRRQPTSSAPGTPPPPVKVDKSFAQWQKHTKGFGLKMMEKMGYKVGQGLGSTKEGIVNPIQSKMRPTKMGIAYKNYKEKSKHEIEEEKRRNGDLTPEADEEAPTASWRKTGLRERTAPRKSRIVYKTAEEVISEVAGDQRVPQTLSIVDMTGPQAREVSAGSITAFTESDKMRLAVDMSMHELERLARERSTRQSLWEAMGREEDHFKALLEGISAREKRLSELVELAAEVEALSVRAVQAFSPLSLDALEPTLRRLAMLDCEPKISEFRVDEFVVAAVAPTVKAMFAEWNPLEDPTFAAGMFARWLGLFRTNEGLSKKKKHSANGLELAFEKTDTNDQMAPYESLMYTAWLPRVRSAVSNAWDVTSGDTLISLLETWQPPLLPTFIYENILDQLVLPKLRRQVEHWNPRLHREKDLLPHHWLHPWLPLLGDRLSDLFSSVRHKFAVALRNANLVEGEGLGLLLPWRKVFRTKDMNNLVDKTVMPRLQEVMRAQFHVNPRNQSLSVFTAVLPWRELSSSKSFSDLLVTEFFPKWLRALHAWLIADPNYDEVAQWLEAWKSLFPPDLMEMATVRGGFKRGLDMFNQSMEMGSNLPHPDLATGAAATGIPLTPSASSVAAARVTFRDIVEEFAQENSQLFLPTSRVHPATGKPLFRFGGRPPAGAGGLWVYLDEDVVFCLTGDADVDSEAAQAEWEPVGLEELLELAEEKAVKTGRK